MICLLQTITMLKFAIIIILDIHVHVYGFYVNYITFYKQQVLVC